MVTLVIFSPRIIFSLTGFQIGASGGASNRWPYFQVLSLKAPWFTAPGGAVLSAWLSTPALAASGKEPALAAASSCAELGEKPAMTATQAAANNGDFFMCFFLPRVWPFEPSDRSNTHDMAGGGVP